MGPEVGPRRAAAARALKYRKCDGTVGVQLVPIS